VVKDLGVTELAGVAPRGDNHACGDGVADDVAVTRSDGLGLGDRVDESAVAVLQADGGGRGEVAVLRADGGGRGDGDRVLTSLGRGDPTWWDTAFPPNSITGGSERGGCTRGLVTLYIGIGVSTTTSGCTRLGLCLVRFGGACGK